MPRVLVTGAAGMIGGAVAKRLRMLGLDVIAVDVTDAGAGNLDIKLAPLEDLDRLRASVGSEPVNAIVHCGAISGPMLAKGDPPTIIRANVIGLTNVLALGLEHRIARFVFCSSIGVYGNAPGGPGPEYHTLKPTSLYGASKVAGEALLTGYAAEYGLNAVSLRIARVYGPGRKGNCLIKAVIERYHRGEPTEISGDPAFLYHYVYIEDVLASIVAALETSSTGHGIYNVSGSRPETLPEIIEHIRAALLGVKVTLVPGEDDVPDIHHWFDNEAARVALGWVPTYGIVDGVRAYAKHLETSER
jgi:UDP-glucuronate 4-epimerase